MRTIKFRARKKDSGKLIGYFNLNNITEYTFGQLRDYIGNLVLEQFTGLKDKNGKEIYEGDILKEGEVEHETLIEVRFGNGTFDSGYYNFTGFFGVYLKVGFGGGFKKGNLCEDMDEIIQEGCNGREVIGNIYEIKEIIRLKKIKWKEKYQIQ